MQTTLYVPYEVMALLFRRRGIFSTRKKLQNSVWIESVVLNAIVSMALLSHPGFLADDVVLPKLAAIKHGKNVCRSDKNECKFCLVADVASCHQPLNYSTVLALVCG